MAEAGKSQEAIMPLPMVKRMLALAEGKPLGCAFGLTKDKKECLLLIEKTGRGKKIAAKLRTEGKELTLDPGTVRFGKVDFDLANDPGTVRFTVNRSEAGGTMITLVRLAKKAGYQGVVINVDGDLENEAEESEGEAEAAPEATGTARPVPPAPPELKPATTPPIDAQALKARLTALVQRMIARIAIEPGRKDEMTRLAKEAQLMLGTNNLRTATEKADALEAILDTAPADGGQGTVAQPDAEALKARLTELAKRMVARIAVEPARKDAMVTLARDGQTKLQGGDLAGAGAAAAALSAMLDSPIATGDGGGRPKGDFVKMQTCRLIWDAARKKVIAEINQYRQAVEQAFAGEEDEDDVLEGLEELDDVLVALDDRLIETLDEMLDERTSAAEYQELLADAKDLLADYEAFVGSSALVSKLDGPTPFGVTLSVASTLGKTLPSLRASLR